MSLKSRSARLTIGLCYYLTMAAMAAASIIAFALVPAYLAGAIGLVAILVTGLIERTVRQSIDTRPKGAAAVCYFIFAAVAQVTSLSLTVSVAKNPGTSWLAWVLAALVFAIVLIAAWVPRRILQSPS